MEFKAEITDKGLKFYKKIKNIFGMEKFKEASEKEVFEPRAKSGELFPNIENMSLDNILILKHKFNLINHISDFGCGVKFEISNYNDKIIKKDETYTGTITFDGIMKNEENNDSICTFSISTEVINNTYKPTKEYYEALFSTTYSGVFTSLEKIDRLHESIGNVTKWECEECGKKFTNRLEFLSHLLETNHYDSIFEQYLYDKDVLFVKNRRKVKKSV